MPLIRNGNICSLDWSRVKRVGLWSWWWCDFHDDEPSSTSSSASPTKHHRFQAFQYIPTLGHNIPRVHSTPWIWTNDGSVVGFNCNWRWLLRGSQHPTPHSWIQIQPITYVITILYRWQCHVYYTSWASYNMDLSERYGLLFVLMMILMTQLTVSYQWIIAPIQPPISHIESIHPVSIRNIKHTSSILHVEYAVWKVLHSCWTSGSLEHATILPSVGDASKHGVLRTHWRYALRGILQVFDICVERVCVCSFCGCGGF